MIASLKKISVIFSLMLALSLMGTPLSAGTLDTAIGQVNQEYSNNKITSRTVRDNLILMLNDANLAIDPDEYSALIEAYRIMVISHAGDEVMQDAADRLLAQVAGL